MNVKLEDLIEIYDCEIRKNTRNKQKLYMFEKNKMENLTYIKYLLENNLYVPSEYNIFLIRDPKYRIVMSLNIVDKIVNHYMARKVLIPKLDKFLDFRIVATRTGFGTDFGIKLIKKYIEINKKYGIFYILKIDISKYFYNIDHNVLKSFLIDKLDEFEYLIMSRIIDSTNNNYINKKIIKLRNNCIVNNNYDSDKIKELPLYQPGKGLSLGAMTSQFLSIFYLSKLDYFIINSLGLKYMVHYMDDIIIMHHDKDHLMECLIKIENILSSEYKLLINNKKTRITSSNEGFTFLGYCFFVKNKKTIIRIKSDTFKRVRQRMKELKYLYKRKKVCFFKVFSSINTYLYSFKYADNKKITGIIDREWFQ